MSSAALLKIAREAGTKRNFGTLNEYADRITPDLKKMIITLCEHIEEQDKRIQALETLKK